MFEQSVIPGSPKGKRVWTTCVGVTGQVLLVTGMVVAPMLWPQVMPPASFVMLVPHAPAGRPKGDHVAKQRAQVTPRRALREFPGLVQPREIPTIIASITDPPAPESAIGGPGLWIDGGTGDGKGLRVLTDVLQAGQDAPRATPVVHEVEPVKAAAAIPRFRTGGNIREPRLVHRVDPLYPVLAKQAHVEGVVRLTGVIGIDGRIAALTVESGNPLLVPAARDAVRQWLYEPTLLNGVPVEVMTSIIVTFTLNR
jgi:protein TonB